MTTDHTLRLSDEERATLGLKHAPACGEDGWQCATCHIEAAVARILAARAAAPVEAGLAERVAALADECANSGCIHLNDMYGKLRALLRPAPAADGGAET